MAHSTDTAWPKSLKNYQCIIHKIFYCSKLCKLYAYYKKYVSILVILLVPKSVDLSSYEPHLTKYDMPISCFTLSADAAPNKCYIKVAKPLKYTQTSP